MAGAAASGYVSDKVVTATTRPWKPVAFGNWLGDRIKKLLDEQETQPRHRVPGVTPLGDIETKLPQTEAEPSTENLNRKDQ